MRDVVEIYHITEQGIDPIKSKRKIDIEKECYFIAARDEEIIQIQRSFHFSEETIEKCIKKDDTVRFQSFEQYDFISFKVLIWKEDHFIVKDLDLYIGSSYIILIGEDAEQEVNSIIQHVLKNIGSVLQLKNTLNKVYFFILDWFLMNLFENIQRLEDHIEVLEEEILQEPNEKYFNQIHALRKQISRARKYIRPLLYIGDEILVNNNSFIQKDMLRYFKNIDIRINKLYDFVQNMQDLAEQLRYTYDSQMTYRTNNIATRLTVLALFFGPLTVITGIYGMNFDYMPELHFRYGYVVVLISMILVVMVLYYWLKKKKWL